MVAPNFHHDWVYLTQARAELYGLVGHLGEVQDDVARYLWAATAVREQVETRRQRK